VVGTVFSAAVNFLMRVLSDSSINIQSAIQAIAAVPASFSYILLFMLPGFLATVLLIRKELVKRKYLLLVTITLSSLLAFIVLWIFYFNYIVGRVCSVIIIGSCAVWFVYRLKSLKEYLLDPLFIRPLTLCFLVGCLYSGTLLLYNSSGDISAIANTRFIWTLPSDNVIPRFGFEVFYNGGTDFSIDEYWMVTDRPPLATAIILLLYRLNIFVANHSFFHQFVGMYVQLLWIPALYYLCDFLSFSKRIRNFIVSCAVFSGVFIINSVYLWPKFSTTIYFCLVLLLILDLADEKKNTVKAATSAVLVGIASAMAILTHGGVMFSFIALGLALLICEKRLKYNYRDLLYVFGAFFIVYIPWHLFTISIDPGGNKLLLVLFTGYDTGYLTLGEAVSRYYLETPVNEIFAATLINFLDMFVHDIWQYTNLNNLRMFVFAKPVATALILNVFLVIAVLYFIYRYCFKKEQMSYNKRIMLVFSILSFTVWPLLVHHQAILYQGSYFNILLLYSLIALGVKHTHKTIANMIFVANMALFFILYFLQQNASVSQSFTNMNTNMLVFTLLAVGGYFVYTYLFDKEWIDKDKKDKGTDSLSLL
jgi:hypothetical protein